MEITYLGHSCVQIRCKSDYILIDPFITPNALASNIDITALKANYVLITHAHQDHIVDTETIAKNNGAKLISNFEIVTHFAQKGIDGIGCNHGGTIDIGFAQIKYVNAVHSSSFPDGSYGGNPGGFVISWDEKRLYVAGDTSLTQDMKLIPLTSGKIDMAILPIGGTFTMDVEEACLAADFIDCNRILGCHYDTFPPIKIDHDKAIQKFANQGKNLTLLPIGDSLRV